MKVVKAETPNDLKGILNFNDDSENYLSCTRMEWVQWLVQQVGLKNDKLGVWVVRDDDDVLKGYLVAVDSVYLPLFTGVAIIYFCPPFTKREPQEIELLEKLEQWAKSRGADRIEINTRQSQQFLRYGFEDSEYSIMFKKIG